MAKLNLVIRCITSRQICFPLIFTIAAISLIVTLVQFSNITVPRMDLRWGTRNQISLRRSERQNTDLWEEWLPDTPKESHDQMNKIPGIAAAGNEENLPKIKVPFLEKDFKRKRSKRRPKLTIDRRIAATRDFTLSRTRGVDESTEERQKAVTEESIASTPYVVKARGQDHDDMGEVSTKDERQGLQNHMNISDYGNTEYAELTENLTDIFDLDDIEQHEDKAHTKLEPLPKQTQGVVIVTNYRSGSTFLGQLFNQHPQAFYTFEPLYPFGPNCSFQVPKRVEILRDMLTCTFPQMKSLYDYIGVNPESSQVHSSCLKNNFCFRYNHEHLCTKDVCPHGDPESCMRCGPVDVSLVNNKCRARKVSVIKVIKLCFLRSLEPLFQDPSLDLKIIHLVRDPRGLASSRLKIHPEWDVTDNIVSTCQRQAANVRAGRNDYWLKNRYKLVRYEDLARKPVELAKEIYDFVGLPFVDSVKNWISLNTRPREDTKTDIRAKRLGLEKQRNYVAQKDPYSTQRDSTSAMQAWRKHLPFSAIEKIQKRCFEALRSLGYKDFNTQSDILNLNLTAIL